MELRKIALSRIPIWRLVDNHVHERDAFYPPVRLFRHGIQSIYSRTKGGVDGSAQASAILRSPTSSFPDIEDPLRQRIYLLEMLQTKRKLETKESFQDLDHFRACLNSVQSLADFVLDDSKELLIVADRKEKECREIDQETTRGISWVPLQEISRLCDAARSRKRYRIPFFNTEDGVKLRLTVYGHETKHMGSEQHCALCGKNSATAGWRGYRSSFQCSMCSVHLCARLHHGFRKNYWTIWHTQRRLELRVTAALSTSGDKDRTNGSSQEQQNAQRQTQA
jgi:hypothetical protein